MRHALPLAAFLALATPAGAQDINAEGAARLVEDLSRYLGAQAFEKGIVKVAVDGDAYRIELDFGALARLSPNQQMLKFEIAPYVVRAKPMPGGNWDVGGDIMPGGWVEFDGPEGRQRAEWSIAGGQWTGTFDPALAAFTSGSGSFDSMTMTSGDDNQQTEVSIGKSAFTLAGTRSATGGVDFSSTQTMADLTETVRLTVPEAPFSFTVKAPSLSFDASAAGFRSRAILDLLAFVVANADEARMKAAQAELKSLLKAALPLWDNMNGAYDVTDLSVETPVGNFGIASVGVDVSWNGIKDDSTLRYSFAASGLKLPPLPQLPAWGVPLLPTDFSITVAGTELNLDKPVRDFIDALDLSQDPPVSEEVNTRIGEEFLADPPKVVFERSFVKNKDTEVAVEGGMSFEGSKPAAQVTVEVTGYDAVVEVLKSASATDPQAQQAFPAALAVKGFAKTLPDGRLQWAIDVRPDGSVFINGGMVKPADPVPLPAPLPQ